MPAISRLLSIVLRAAQLAFGVIVTGIIGRYFDRYNAADGWPHARFIYTIVVSSLSILLALLWLIPFTSGFTSWPADIFISFAWFTAFGLLVNFLHGTCNSSTFDWSGIASSGTCNRWQAAQAFSFLSAIVWLVSGFLGIWFIQRKTRGTAATTEPAVGTSRRGLFGHRHRI